MANPHRAEVDLKTPNRVFTLRLSMNDMAALQNELHVGVPYELAERISTHKFGVVEMAAVLRRALKTGGLFFPPQRAGETVSRIMEQAGMSACLEAVLGLIAASISDETADQSSEAEGGEVDESSLFPEDKHDPL